MADRRELQAELEAILGSRNVYYNPPETVKITYPAIVYSKDRIEHVFANNAKYTNNKLYTIIFICKTPDNPVIDDVLKMPLSHHVRTYVADNLYHDVINVYY